MPAHDIIDNRNEKLVDHINRILPSTERAKFAVGYFFLSGLAPIEENLKNVRELRLLIGNTTNQETLEQLTEGYKRLELVERAAEGMRFPKRGEVRHMLDRTRENLKEAVEVMDQTDQGEALIGTLVRLIEEKRLRVRVYTKGRLHAKAYIFDYRDDGRYEKGIAIVGSSHLSISGITHNTELNVVVHGTNNHEELSRWFEELWKEAQDFDEHLMQELRSSWALAKVTPYDVYLKTLYTLVKDRLEETEEAGILWDDDITEKLANFQKVAVRQAIQIIKDYGGCFVADVVGLGKSYIGAAIIKHFERSYHARPLIICPASLVEMWERYNEIYHLNARVLSMGLLKEGEDGQFNYLLDEVKYRDRDFVLVDESHNFRHTNTQRYKVLQNFLATGRRTVFLTATPRTRSAWDIYNQIKLFHQDDRTDLPIVPPDLKQYFKVIEEGKKRLQDLLSHILIRRTRNHILRWYGYDAETNKPINPSRFQDYIEGKRRAYVLVGGKKQFFPHRKLETIEYSIEATYQGLYNRIRRYLGRPQGQARVKTGERELTYARYGLWNYVKKEWQKKHPYNELQRAGANLRGLIRVMLFKRFESSVYAFRATLRRLHRIHQLFLEALNQGMVPAGDDAQALLYESDLWEESELFDVLRKLTGKYDVEHFEDALHQDIQQDMELLQEMIDLVAPISPEKDAKLQTLLARLQEKPLSEGKVLIFTQYADTAQYLFENLNPGGQKQDIEVIYSGDKSKVRVVGRFAPKANPEYRFHKGESEINLLVATDVLSEGLNLQDCDKIINYDLHWNPVRLIQRFGRIDRIGSEHDVIWGFNFLPETELDKNLGLKDKLANRIQEIHETIGLDAAVLDSSEQLNPEAMYAIYEKRSGGQLSLFEEPDEIIDLNEAEEFMRQLKKENPEEFERIANLRDGIRVGKASDTKGTFVFCQAGKYQKLFLMNRNSEIVNPEISEILNILRCGPEQPSEPLPPDHNQTVMKARRLFEDEVRHRVAMREQTTSLSHGQRYVIREMRVLYGMAKDDDLRHQINIIEKAFRGPVTAAINRELNRLRRNGITGEDLLKSLINIYHQHGMKDWIAKAGKEGDKAEIVKIICSEALI